jgi:hypothetical protein
MNTHNNAYFYEERNKLKIKLIQVRNEFAAVEADYQVKRDIFLRNSEYKQSLL